MRNDWGTVVFSERKIDLVEKQEKYTYRVWIRRIEGEAIRTKVTYLHDVDHSIAKFTAEGLSNSRHVLAYEITQVDKEITG